MIKNDFYNLDVEEACRMVFNNEHQVFYEYPNVKSYIYYVILDDKSAAHMYGVYLNPLTLTVRQFKGYPLCLDVCINSIDDSTYSIYFYNNDVDTLMEYQSKIVNYIKNNKPLNGEKFLNYCVSIGGDEDSISYD